jgi:carboxyl-terminal processing protease
MAYPDATDYTNRFSATDLFNSLPDSLKTRVSALGKNLVELRLKALLARYRWRINGYFEVINTQDPVVQKALILMSK